MRILHTTKFDSRWEAQNPANVEEIKKILNQKFVFLGRGYQSFAFESQDHQYVLKFACLSHFKIPDFVQTLSLPDFLEKIRDKKMAKKEKNLPQYFFSNKLGFDKLQNESGIIYIHFNPTEIFKKQVKISDPIHRIFYVNLDPEVFILQKKMTPFRNLLKEYHAQHEVEKEQKLIGDLVEYISGLMKRGFIDTDRNFYKNYGIMDGKIACLDTGNLREDSNLLYGPHFNVLFEKVLSKTRRWLVKNYPEHVQFFDQKIQMELVKEKV